MTTTIQISESLRNSLLELKKSNKTSYEDIIKELLNKYLEEKKVQEELLIEGYREMAELSKEICEEWKYVDAENLPEWK